ncbi:MAG: phage minor capsid protein [Anaerolineaceae bacterium]|nr:phage minor capsid protein [Anaerolineaceae bacterium]
MGADGVELSAHGGCAPDHLPYQGRQFSKRQFEKLQGELERPIGEYNCRHIAFPILLGISRPAHTEKELNRLEEMSTRRQEFDGKEYTQYEATQLQRKLETAMRQTKDRALLAKESGDDLGRRVEQTKLNQLKSKYVDVCQKFGLPYKSERMSMSGFRAVNVTVDSLTSGKAATEYFVKNIGIDKSKLFVTGMSKKTAVFVGNGIEKVFKTYPKLKSFLSQPDKGGISYKTSNSGAIAECNRLTQHIGLNPIMFDDLPNLKQTYADMVNIGWSPLGTDYHNVVTHELGHAMHGMLSYNGINIAQFQRDVLNAAGISFQEIKTAVSEYATINEREFFAECFSELIGSKNPRRVAVKFGIILEEVMKALP